MRNKLLIILLFCVGCSSNNLVEECDKNFIESASTIETVNRLMILLTHNNVVNKPSRTPYLIKLQSLDSIYEDSLLQAKTGYSKAQMTLNKKEAFDSAVYGYPMMYCLPAFPFFEVDYTDSILAIYPKVNEYIDSLAINTNNSRFTIIPVINNQNKKVHYYYHCINYTRGWGYKLDDIANKKMVVNSTKAAPNWKAHYDYIEDLYHYAK